MCLIHEGIVLFEFAKLNGSLNKFLTTLCIYDVVTTKQMKKIVVKTGFQTNSMHSFESKG